MAIAAVVVWCLKGPQHTPSLTEPLHIFLQGCAHIQRPTLRSEYTDILHNRECRASTSCGGKCSGPINELLVMSSIVDFFANDSSTISLAQARQNLPFLLSQADVPSLIANTNFTSSLECRLGFETKLCLEICGNMSTAFANWPNFYTCSWFPEISATLDESNVTGEGIDRLKTIGIPRNQLQLSSNISSNIGNCLADFCQYSEQCQDSDIYHSCARDSLFLDNGSSKALNRSAAAQCVRYGVCGSTAEINPDIGGLGVSGLQDIFQSFYLMIQVVLSLLVQYSISLLGIFLHSIFYIRCQVAQRHIRRTSRVETMDTRLIEAERSFNSHLGSLTSALVEFQKSQCFFSATLQIAALIVLPTYLDQILLRLTSANAFSPIMLTLAHIDFLGGRNSWYLLFLSGVSFVLGTATYWAASPQLSGAAVNAYLFYENPVAPIFSCGNIAPFAPCFNRNEFFRYGLWPQITGVYYDLPERSGLVVWIISFLIFVYRVTSKICAVQGNGLWLLKHLKTAQKTLQKTLKRLSARLEASKLSGKLSYNVPMRVVSRYLEAFGRHSCALIFQQRFWEYSQLTVGSIALFLQFISAIKVLKYSSNIISTQMSFGQIVAVGIWVPVLLEYGYLGISKVLKPHKVNTH